MTGRESTCPGPFIWFEVMSDERFTAAAVLECAECGHFTVTGWWNRPDHARTPWMKEGLAS